MRSRMVSLAVLASMALVPTRFSLAAAPADPADDADTLEEVLVLGSRERADALLVDAPSPVDSFDRAAIDELGIESVQEILARMPAALQSTSRADSVGFGLDFATYSGTPFPTSVANLRDLGADRTLVLINGRRHVAGSSDSSAVDTNAIPVSMIERVDLITGSAAALYGGDAAAGALNFVLRDRFEGFQASAQYRQYDGGLGAEYSASLLSGFNFGPGSRGNVMAALDYGKREEINARNSGVRTASTYQPVGNPNLYVQNDDLTPAMFDAGVRAGDFIAVLDPAVQALFSPARLALANDERTIAYLRGYKFAEYNATGSFGIDVDGDGLADGVGGDLNGDGVDDCETAWPFNGGRQESCWTLDENSGALRPYRGGTFFGSYASPDGDGDIYPPDDVTILDPRFERMVLAVNSSYQLGETSRAFLETKFAAANAANRADTAFNVVPRYQPLALDNPFVPQSLRDLFDDYAAANPGADLSGAQFMLSRDLFTTAARDKQTSRTVQATGGVRGALSDATSYEVSAQFGRTTQRNPRQVVYTDRLYAALDAVSVGGQAVCRSSVDPNAVPPGYAGEFLTFEPGDGQCSPLNPFAPGGSFPVQSAATLAFLNQSARVSNRMQQTGVRAQLFGDLPAAFQFTPQSITYSAGVEYRRESTRTSASQDIVDGLVYGTSLTPIAGAFSVSEIFADVAVPLLSGVTGAQELTLTATGRYADYSRSGGAMTFGTGLVWSPLDGLRLRGSYTRAVRAPTVANLFVPGGSFTSTGGTGYDPCIVTEIDLGPAPENRAANCAAAGIPDNFTELPGVGEFVEISGTNAALNPEKARTLTAGFVVAPGNLSGTSFSADYFRIRLQDSIEFVDYASAIQACYDGASLDNPFCGQFTRDNDAASPTYRRVLQGASQLLNFGTLVTSGIDFAVRSQWSLQQAGSLSLDVNATRLLRIDEYRIAGQPDVGNSRLGEYESPKWTATTRLAWKRGRFDASWNTLLYGRQFSTDEETLPFITTEFGGPALRLDAVWVHDLSVGYDLNRDVSLRGGVGNVTNERPPRFLSDTLPVNAFGRQYFLDASWTPGKR